MASTEEVEFFPMAHARFRRKRGGRNLIFIWTEKSKRHMKSGIPFLVFARMTVVVVDEKRDWKFREKEPARTENRSY